MFQERLVQESRYPRREEKILGGHRSHLEDAHAGQIREILNIKINNDSNELKCFQQRVAL